MKESYETDVKKLAELFNESKVVPGAFYRNRELNREARFSWWSGKTPDGRRWKPRKNDAEVLPWPGASDMVVPMVDTYCKQDAALLCTALNRITILATGLESNDVAFGNRVNNLLRWQLFNQMTEFNEERRLLANWFVEDGADVLGVFWDREVQMSYQEVTMDMIYKLATQAGQTLQQDGEVQMAMQQGAPPPQGFQPLTPEQQAQLSEAVMFPQKIKDPTFEDEMTLKIQEWAGKIVEVGFKQALGEYEDELMEDYELKESRARKIVRELRTKDRSEIPVPAVSRNQPTVVALRNGDDFFVAKGTADWRNAPAMFWREWVTAETLKERVISRGYDEDWVKYAIKNHKGGGDEWEQNAAVRANGTAQALGEEEHGERWLDTEDLIGIVHGYERRCNEDGVPGIYCTVFHPDFDQQPAGYTGEVYAKTELLGYKHGQYPFLNFRREFLSRRIDDSRGYGEIAATAQWLVKQEADLEVDRSWLTTVPPLHHPPGRPPSQWGPGVKVGARNTDYRYADTPDHDPGSEEVRRLVMEIWNVYFAREGADGANQFFANLERQDMINNWLEGWRQALMMIFQLDQQYMPNEFYYRVVGSEKGRPIRGTREEIQGKFDIVVGFNTAYLSPEHLKDMMLALKEIATTMNMNGRLDTDALMVTALEWIDPNLAERLIKPGEDASLEEVEDEKTVFAKIWSGLDQDVKPVGQAWGLRLQTLQNIMFGDNQEGEPNNADARMRYEKDEKFRERIDKRMQQLNHQVEQRTVNPMKGVLGG